MMIMVEGGGRPGVLQQNVRLKNLHVSGKLKAVLA
jgi:hypothetical protein